MFLSRRKEGKINTEASFISRQTEDNYKELQSAFCPAGSNVTWSLTQASKSRIKKANFKAINDKQTNKKNHAGESDVAKVKTVFGFQAN